MRGLEFVLTMQRCVQLSAAPHTPAPIDTSERNSQLFPCSPFVFSLFAQHFPIQVKRITLAQRIENVLQAIREIICLCVWCSANRICNFTLIRHLIIGNAIQYFTFDVIDSIGSLRDVSHVN